MQRSLDQAAGELRRRVFAALWLGHSARLAMGFLFAGGTLALALRLGWNLERGEAALAFAPLLAVPIVAWWMADRRRLSPGGAVTWLDLRLEAGGALLTQHEHDDPRWRARSQAALARALPLPRVRLARPALQVLPALAFALAALWIEMPRDPLLPPRHVEEAALERVQEKLETLEEQVTLEPELAEELETRLERLQDEPGTPEEAFEAIDRLDQRLDQEGERLGEQLRDAQSALARAAESATSDPEGAQRELEQTLGELARAGLDKNLPEDLQKQLGSSSLELPPGTQLSKEQLQKLSTSLANDLNQKLAQLGEAGLAKLGKLSAAGKLAKLEGFEPTGHVCDENCKKNPGGT